jgi:lipopolysaccharide biosynthesis regulator YciM
LELRWQIYALAGNWDVAVELAEKLMEAKIPDCAERAFNLACQACRLKRVDDARRWVERACELGGKAMKRRAVDEPRLDAAWLEWQ